MCPCCVPCDLLFSSVVFPHSTAVSVHLKWPGLEILSTGSNHADLVEPRKKNSVSLIASCVIQRCGKTGQCDKVLLLPRRKPQIPISGDEYCPCVAKGRLSIAFGRELVHSKRRIGEDCMSHVFFLHTCCEDPTCWTQTVWTCFGQLTAFLLEDSPQALQELKLDLQRLPGAFVHLFFSFSLFKEVSIWLGRVPMPRIPMMSVED